MDVDVGKVLEAGFSVPLFECAGCVVWDALFFVVVEYSDIVGQAGGITQKHPVNRLNRLKIIEVTNTFDLIYTLVLESSLYWYLEFRYD
jgi:hypothetical protein